MNEIIQIHLGRTAFTIAVDAQKLLRDYLAAVRKHAGSDEVAEEVELRMAELLAERGITGDKVMLAKDVEYLKEQLGEPGEFDDEDVAGKKVEADDAAPRRLFRDPEHGMIAGVAAGLGNYVGIDAVIVRILFIALTFFGGGGILLYVILWLLVPEAKTKSERLQMQGMAVTVDTIARTISDADVPGAVQRASRQAVSAVAVLIRAVLAVTGIAFVVGGIGIIIADAIAAVYVLLRGLQVDNATLFPVGKEQVAVFVCAVVLLGLIGGMLAASGVALVRRKWSMPGWALAAVIGVFIATVSVGAGLGVDAAPMVRDRYQGFEHSRTYQMQPIKTMHLRGDNVAFQVVEAASPSVEIRTFGTVDTHAIMVNEKDGVLTVDTTNFQPQTTCRRLCIFGGNRTEVVVRMPHAATIPLDATGGSLVIEGGSKDVFGLSLPQLPASAD